MEWVPDSRIFSKWQRPALKGAATRLGMAHCNDQYVEWVGGGDWQVGLARIVDNNVYFRHILDVLIQSIPHKLPGDKSSISTLNENALWLAGAVETISLPCPSSATRTYRTDAGYVVAINSLTLGLSVEIAASISDAFCMKYSLGTYGPYFDSLVAALSNRERYEFKLFFLDRPRMDALLDTFWQYFRVFVGGGDSDWSPGFPSIKTVDAGSIDAADVEQRGGIRQLLDRELADLTVAFVLSHELVHIHDGHMMDRYRHHLKWPKYVSKIVRSEVEADIYGFHGIFQFFLFKNGIFDVSGDDWPEGSLVSEFRKLGFRLAIRRPKRFLYQMGLILATEAVESFYSAMLILERIASRTDLIDDYRFEELHIINERRARFRRLLIAYRSIRIPITLGFNAWQGRDICYRKAVDLWIHSASEKIASELMSGDHEDAWGN